MRKTLLFASLLCATTSFSQIQSQLVSLTSAELGEKTDFRYNEDNKVNWIGMFYQFDPDYNAIDLIDYDENGRQTKDRVYQDMDVIGGLDHEAWHFNSIVDYEYDDLGQLIQRINYNNWNRKGEPSFDMGAVMTWEYDSEGRITVVKTFWDAKKTDLGQEIRHEYTDGILTKKSNYMFDYMTKELRLSDYDEYSYDAEGRLVETANYVFYPNIGECNHESTVKYDYDNAGRLVKKTIMTASGRENSKIEYKYDGGLPASAVAFPIHNEGYDDNDMYRMFTEAPVSYDEYVLDDRTNALAFLGTYEYVYQSVSGVNGIISDNDTPSVSIRRVSGGRILLDGVACGSMVRVFGADGSLLSAEHYNASGIDLGSTSRGIYCVATENGTIKVRL